jgi:hypothetical protein
MSSPSGQTREEINRKAGVILERAQQLTVSRGRACDDEARGDVVTKLRRECQALRSELKQLKVQYSKLQAPPPPVIGSRDEVSATTQYSRICVASFSTTGCSVHG